MIILNKYAQYIKNNPYPRYLESIKQLSEDAENSYTNSTPMLVQKNNKPLINFSSNDYLGLSKHPLLIERSQHYLLQYGTSFSSSRLVTGNHFNFDEIESKLAAALNKEAALIIGSGYQTNATILEALLSPKALAEQPFIFCDKFCHASIMSTLNQGHHVKRFKHNDLNHLEKLLEKYAELSPYRFLVIESLYSMDGDLADLNKIIQLAKHYQALLYVDDAHSVGIYGRQGWGLAGDFSADIDIVMGTFSKALGSYGGYIACSSLMKEYLVNNCRGLIYTTALTPANLGAISAVIDLLPSLNQLRKRLLSVANLVKDFFKDNGLELGNSNSHIIPWIIGDAQKTIEMSKALEKQGILAVPIRPPTVQPQQSRLRFCISAAHTDEDIEQLFKAVKAIIKAT